MDNLPETLADALAALTKINADYAALETLATDASTQLSEVKQQHAAVQMAYDALTKSNETLVAQVAELQAKVNDLKTQEVDANAKAIEIVAALGVEPVAVVTETQNPTQKQTLAERLEGVTDPRKRGEIRAEFLNSLK
jgi:predicted  nucleic acid-binding Zn-ribbon protein